MRGKFYILLKLNCCPAKDPISEGHMRIEILFRMICGKRMVLTPIVVLG